MDEYQFLTITFTMKREPSKMTLTTKRGDSA
ncbi:hypothetical protein SIID45300_00173 [Candidatus Magnetaquicoccaceae bacterium FCR-1]|uniref:Uncharacterized protein n=1 Tax=Candidatus Magnetaquiglobus chichijimensis TaxID=3141448 RepID=A0ABQ0C4S0_9PROT